MASLIPSSLVAMPTADTRGALSALLQASQNRTAGLGGIVDVTKGITDRAAEEAELLRLAQADARAEEQLKLQQQAGQRADEAAKLNQTKYQDTLANEQLARQQQTAAIDAGLLGSGVSPMDTYAPASIVDSIVATPEFQAAQPQQQEALLREALSTPDARQMAITERLGQSGDNYAAARSDVMLGQTEQALNDVLNNVNPSALATAGGIKKVGQDIAKAYPNANMMEITKTLAGLAPEPAKDTRTPKQKDYEYATTVLGLPDEEAKRFAGVRTASTSSPIDTSPDNLYKVDSKTAINISKAISGLGNPEEVSAIWEAAQKSGPEAMAKFNRAFTELSGYNPETDLLSFDFGKRDINTDALRNAITTKDTASTERPARREEVALRAPASNTTNPATLTPSVLDTVAQRATAQANTALGGESGAVLAEEDTNTPLETGPTLEESARINEEMTISNLAEIAGSKTSSPLFSNTNYSHQEVQSAKAKLRELYFSNPYEFKKKYPKIVDVIYN